MLVKLVFPIFPRVLLPKYITAKHLDFIAKMADEGSLAKNRTRRVRKEKRFDDESPPPRASISKTKEETPTSATKRKAVETNNVNGRPSRSKTKPEPKDIDSKPSKSKEESTHTQVPGGLDQETLSFTESLKNKSGLFNDTSIERKKTNLKITTWNINGLRAWVTKQSGMKFIREDGADIFCFQETKCGNSKIPLEIRYVEGYSSYFNGSEDGHHGVLCMTKEKPLKVTNGIGIEIYDKEARVITLEFDEYYVVNVYVPNSGRGLVRLDFRMKWDADFMAYLKDLDSKKPVIICGDLNVSHHEIDLANPKTNLKTAGFTIGERNNFSKLLAEAQFVDIFRLLNPDKLACYTYWSYFANSREKNVGWRLDYFLLPQRWYKRTCDVVIRSEVHGSDHCPVSIYLAV